MNRHVSQETHRHEFAYAYQLRVFFFLLLFILYMLARVILAQTQIIFLVRYRINDILVNMEKPKQFNISAVEVGSKTDVMLLMSRLAEGSRRMTKILGGADPEISTIALAQINLKQFYFLNRRLNEELAKLTSESETLIDSPNANSPEIKAKRKVLADKINAILDEQKRLEDELNIQDSETAVNTASKDQLTEANSLVQPILREMELIANPVSGAN